MRSILVLSTMSAAVFAATVYSYQRGALPGATGQAGTVPVTIARNGQGCGQCHTPTAGAPLPSLDFAPQQRSLDLSQAIQVTATANGGVNGTHGGFVAEATAGAFSAGTTSKIDATGAFITHQIAGFGRTWQFGYTAPATPGVIEIWAAGNTADGDASENGDSWAFLGGAQANSAPTRLYANAAGVTNLGDGCVGGFGQWPVLGAPQSPTVGNPTFRLELHSAPPATAAIFLLGTTPVSLSLTPFGVDNCTLYTLPSLQLTIPTSPGGTAVNGDGTAALPLPLPNNPAIRGVMLHAQVLVIDPASGRPANATMSNAVTITVL